MERNIEQEWRQRCPDVHDSDVLFNQGSVLRAGGGCLVPGMSLELSRGVMILIQQNICDGRCTCENPKDMAALTSVPSPRHPHSASMTDSRIKME